MDSNRAQLSYVLESTFATIPSNPVWQILRLTGEDLKAAKETVVSAEIRSDRQVSDLAKVSNGASGGIKFEQSYGAHSALIQAAMGLSAASANVDESVGVNVDLDESSATITRASGTWSVTPIAGQFLKVSGFTDPENNGIKRVVSATTTVITFASGSFPGGDEAAVAGVAIKGKAYKNGIALPTFSLERKTVNNASADYFQRYSGMGVDEWSLSIGVGKINEGTFNFIGAVPSASDTEVAGATYTAATTAQVQNATSHVAQVLYDGAAATEHLTALEFTVKNNLRAKAEIGNDTPWELGSGEFNVSGKFTAYFKDNALYASIIAHDYVSLAWVTTDAAGNSMAFHFPKVSLMTADPNVPGKNTDIMLDLPFQAIMDPDTGSTMIVTEIAA